MTISELLKFTRQHFWELGFEEVEVSYLNESLPLEANLYSFETIWRNLGTKYYLPTSPEFALKAHLAKNKKDCFSISHCFRDLENSGPQHHPEFLMLEWYEVNKNINEIKESTKNFLNHLYREVLHLPLLSFRELTLDSTNIDTEPDFNQFFLNEVEPTLPKDSAVFISGYPTFLSPLASSRETSDATSFRSADRRVDITRDASTSKVVASDVSERFELYINGIEIANACTENRNPEQIKSAFLSEQKFREEKRLPTHPFSEKFITNSSLLPPCSGIGLGLERVLMIINKQTQI